MRKNKIKMIYVIGLVMILSLFIGGCIVNNGTTPEIQSGTTKIVQTGSCVCETCERTDETAWAFGETTFISLGISTKWGWVFNYTVGSGPVVKDLWAGAGQNDTSKGTLVGNVTVSDDGTNLYVNYNITEPGWNLINTHLYVGTSFPTTAAPGQLGHQSATGSYVIPLGSWGTGTLLRIAAHADVNGPASCTPVTVQFTVDPTLDYDPVSHQLQVNNAVNNAPSGWVIGYEWFINGVKQSATGPTMDFTHDPTKNETITVNIVFFHDGQKCLCLTLQREFQILPARLTIKKVLEPGSNAPGGPWSFTLTGPNSFSATFNLPDNGNWSKVFETLEPGEYTIQETQQSGYECTKIEVSIPATTIDLANCKATFILESTADVTVTFTNRQTQKPSQAFLMCGNPPNTHVWWSNNVGSYVFSVLQFGSICGSATNYYVKGAFCIDPYILWNSYECVRIEKTTPILDYVLAKVNPDLVEATKIANKINWLLSKWSVYLGTAKDQLRLAIWAYLGIPGGVMNAAYDAANTAVESGWLPAGCTGIVVQTVKIL